MSMTFRLELLDELLQGYDHPEDLLGEGGILKQLSKALVERCLQAQTDTHLAEQRALKFNQSTAQRAKSPQRSQEKTIIRVSCTPKHF